MYFMCCTSTFWKCVWFENIGRYNKSYERESKECYLKVLSIFFSFGIVRCVLEESLPISTLSYPRLVSCSASAFYALSHSLSKCWHAFCHAHAWGRQTNDISHAALRRLAKWREIMAANVVTFPQKKYSRANKQNKTSQTHTPRFSMLTAADLSQ